MNFTLLGLSFGQIIAGCVTGLLVNSAWFLYFKLVRFLAYGKLVSRETLKKEISWWSFLVPNAFQVLLAVGILVSWLTGNQGANVHLGSGINVFTSLVIFADAFMYLIWDHKKNRTSCVIYERGVLVNRRFYKYESFDNLRIEQGMTVLRKGKTELLLSEERFRELLALQTEAKASHP